MATLSSSSLPFLSLKLHLSQQRTHGSVGGLGWEDEIRAEIRETVDFFNGKIDLLLLT